MSMTKGERDDLQRLVRQREKVLKSAAKQRSTDLVADFENQLGTIYRFDQDHIWKQVMEAAQCEFEKVRDRVAARSRELGIPDRFAPHPYMGWSGRGSENLVADRRAELRLMAKRRIEAIEQEAIVKIEMASVNLQTEIAASGLTTEAAALFLKNLPSIEVLMPTLAIGEMARDAEPPIAEQLVSPNALRQRRYRERLRNAGDVTPALGDASGDGKGGAR